MSVLNVLRDNYEKPVKYCLVLGQILFRTPCSSKILYWINPNNQTETKKTSLKDTIGLNRQWTGVSQH